MKKIVWLVVWVIASHSVYGLTAGRAYDVLAVYTFVDGVKYAMINDYGHYSNYYITRFNRSR